MVLSWSITKRHYPQLNLVHVLWDFAIPCSSFIYFDNCRCLDQAQYNVHNYSSNFCRTGAGQLRGCRRGLTNNWLTTRQKWRLLPDFMGWAQPYLSCGLGPHPAIFYPQTSHVCTLMFPNPFVSSTRLRYPAIGAGPLLVRPRLLRKCRKAF